MKKRLLSLLVILVLAFSLCAAAHAGTDLYVWDETDHITGEDLEILRQLGARIYDTTGAAVCVCITEETGENVHEFAERFWQENVNEPEGIILAHNPASNTVSYAVYGERLRALDEEEISKLLDAYNTRTDYFEAAHSFMNAVFAELGGAESEIRSDLRLSRVVDLAGVIDDTRLSSLNELADRVSEKYNCDIAAAIVPSLEGKYVVDYADDYFIYNGYGKIGRASCRERV